ncbi:hypothetical protein Syun_010406 [Stephania yunnanensis]|uniref:Uncharacterized protein n=1 Tax=Stephania yunnanensis TaxID=152371 RepID=A0AAP0KGF9_9MAGN
MREGAPSRRSGRSGEEWARGSSQVASSRRLVGQRAAVRTTRLVGGRRRGSSMGDDAARADDGQQTRRRRLGRSAYPVSGGRRLWRWKWWRKSVEVFVLILEKEVHRTAETMSKAHHDYVDNQALKFSSCLNPAVLKESYDNPSDGSIDKAMSSSSLEHCWNPEENTEVGRRAFLKRSQSVGSHLHREIRAGSDEETENEIDRGFSDGSNGNNSESQGNDSAKASYWQNEEEQFEQYDTDINSLNQFHPDLNASLIQANDDELRGKSIFSIGDVKHVEEETHTPFVTQLASEHVSEFGPSTPLTPRIEKSRSFPNVRHSSENDSPSQLLRRCRTRSSEDLDALDARRKEILNNAQLHAMEGEGKENDISGSKKVKWDSEIGGGYDEYDIANYERDSTVSGRHGDDMNKHEGESSGVKNREELLNAEFKMKRIEEWVSKINLGDANLLDEISDTPQSIDMVKKASHVWNNVTNAKLDPKNSHGMEAAKHYISSLTATSTAAQLNNLGLVVIPFLSAFVSLKVLNLSGNSIVRITAGALPRGLHMLNLSKNNISNIEGLRELGRLRVLDLSCNRILRIGHGTLLARIEQILKEAHDQNIYLGFPYVLDLWHLVLDARINSLSLETLMLVVMLVEISILTLALLGGLASCSSLKELYLAGNKISEVEGLHRLLKLNVLDLRFNKISTAKCLGQLAANYASLHSLNLEGNPAQTNVGDEQSPQSAQPGRLLLPTPSERSLRSEHKLIRKGIHNAAIGKGLPSSSQGLRGHSVRSPKRNKDHHGRLPPAAGTRGTHHHRHHFMDASSRWSNLRLADASSIRKSRSEEFLGFS